MFLASHDITANGMASTPQAIWGNWWSPHWNAPDSDEILVRGLLIEFVSMTEARTFSREMESYRQMIRSHAF